MINLFRNDNIKNRIVIDTLVNLVGTLLPVAIIQLIVFPKLSKQISYNEYGLIQSIMSVVYLVGATLGDSLCSARLIQEQKYQREHLSGDFNIINVINIIFLLCLTPTILFFHFRLINISEIILTSIVMLLSYTCGYLAVRYRLNIDYKNIFVNHIIGSIGYITGYGIFLISGKWQYIYITYFSAKLFHLILHSTLIKEPFSTTKLFKDLINTLLGLSISSFLSKALNYFDKIVLYSILGGHLVSIYFTANILGKLVVQITEPFNHVVLTYLSKKETVNKELWYKVIVYNGIIMFFSYFICMIISKSLIQFLYPQWSEEATKYIPITSASLCLSSYSSLITPFALKMIDTRFQIVINGISVCIYIFLIFAWSKYGLMACCIAILISNMIKAILAIIMPILLINRK